jgi:hypothetical protein
MTSGRTARYCATASAPDPASPTTSDPLGGQRTAQARPDYRMIIGQQDPDHATSPDLVTRAVTVVPAPGALRTARSPPISVTLARIPRRPNPPLTWPGLNPVPSSVTSSLTPSSR